MKMFILLILAISPFINFGQYCASFDLTLEDEIDLGCPKNTLTALHDQMGRNYLYTANAQGGFSVLSTSDPEDLTSVVYLDATNFEDFTVNRITQDGNYLYLAIGTVFGAHDQPSGLAIINVTDPLSPVVEDIWTSETDGGAAYVAVRGDLAYLCGLSNGVIVLNISDKTDITFVSSYIPPTDWPVGTDVGKIKARNIVLNGDVAYLAYDAGGMRILDISNASELVEIGRYSNPAMDGAARAYNNIIKRGNLLYIAVDYAGMEVLDISNMADVTLHGWWNPNGFPLANPFATSFRWFSSPWHTNEMEIVDECGIIFMSSGRTEVIAIDVSDPSAPELCGFFGDSTDNNSSYGMTYHNGRVYVGLICTLIAVPFFGDWSGIKSFVYDSDCPLGIAEETKHSFKIYPNPTPNNFTISFDTNDNYGSHLPQLFEISGKEISLNQIGPYQFNVSHLDPGIYIVRINTQNGVMDQKLIIE